MAVDISKVFKANVKAIRTTLSDGVNNLDNLNSDLLGSKKAAKRAPGGGSNIHEFVSKSAKNIVTNKL